MKNDLRIRLAGTAGFVLAASLATLLLAQPAAPAFAGIFSDHAVLQRGEALTVWGRAAPRDSA
ncbi:hypothetical protein [Massilia pseudoviolaceinigra]|uniref:hypothetical protein n=1 Tax=Massilia pseudoviolaceinigra TaxID=3057165 RepID=UPI0027964952|nr:hypothetical protein [Massilia sp. CCM 9206]MDQ1919189.1 hypothetical protein [Massilia sp. CCM 9206]